MTNTILSFQCNSCGLVFEVAAELLNIMDQESTDDFCCPLCRSNTLMLFVEQRDT